MNKLLLCSIFSFAIILTSNNYSMHLESFVKTSYKPIDICPDEVITKILVSLIETPQTRTGVTNHVIELCKLRLVNTLFRSIVDSKTLWYQIFNKYSDAQKLRNLSHIDRYAPQLIKSYILDYCKKQDIQKLCKKNANIAIIFQADKYKYKRLDTIITNSDLSEAACLLSFIFNNILEANNKQLENVTEWFDYKTKPAKRIPGFKEIQDCHISNEKYLQHSVLQFKHRCDTTQNLSPQTTNLTALIRRNPNLDSLENSHASAFFNPDTIGFTPGQILIMQHNNNLFEKIIDNYSVYSYQDKKELVNVACFCNNIKALHIIIEKLYTIPLNKPDLLFLTNIVKKYVTKNNIINSSECLILILHTLKKSQTQHYIDELLKEIKKIPSNERKAKIKDIFKRYL